MNTQPVQGSGQTPPSISSTQETAPPASSPSSTDTSDAVYSTMDEVPKEFLEIWMESVAKGICDKMKRDQDRLKRLMKEMRE